MNNLSIKEHLELFLKEDIGYSDITTESVIFENKIVQAKIKVKEDSVICGLKFLPMLFHILDKDAEIIFQKKDGDFVFKGEVVAIVNGNAKTLLSVERTALNLLQRLSGVATLTRKMQDLIKNRETKLVDTRKTTPGLRYFEKYAVRTGGAVNHRFGLFDSVLIKDNHIKIAGSISKAVELAKKNTSFTVKIEVEASNLEDVEESIKSGADIVLLDNMSVDQLKVAVNMCKGKLLTEASGNINPDTIVQIADTGVDFISAGFVTHHAVWCDINMKVS